MRKRVKKSIFKLGSMGLLSVIGGVTIGISSTNEAVMKLDFSLNNVSSNNNADFNYDDPTDGFDRVELESGSGIYIKVPDFTEDENKAQNIANTYGYTPSTIQTDTAFLSENNDIQKPATTNIWNVLEVDPKVWNDFNVSNHKDQPSALNLSSKSTYMSNYLNIKESGQSWENYRFQPETLTDNKNLPPFQNGIGGEQIINQQYLDEQGILALQLRLTDKSNTNKATTKYILIPGFSATLNKNSRSGNPILPSETYTHSVGAVSDKTLLDNIDFSEKQHNLTKSVVKGTRENNSNEGSISIVANFSWSVPADVDFLPSFPGVMEKSRSSSYSTAETDLKYNLDNKIIAGNNWSKKFIFNGFQPAPNVTTTQLIIIIAAIIISTVVLSTLAFGATKLAKIIRDKRAK